MHQRVGRLPLFLTVSLALTGCVQQLAYEDWAFGPFEKLGKCLEPLDSSTFHCPVRGRDVAWENKDVFNPAALVYHNKVCLLYRAEDREGERDGTSRIGLAISTNGIEFSRTEGLESVGGSPRPYRPVLFPAVDDMTKYEWDGGTEDPRVVEDGAGTYYMTYTGYNSAKEARLMVASSRHPLSWTKHGPAFELANGGRYLNTWSKSGSIVCRRDGNHIIATRISGKYWMYWGDSHVFVATSENLMDWTVIEERPGRPLRVLNPRQGKFDSALVEPGPPALLTEHGIVLLYNGMNSTAENGGDPNLPRDTYCGGQALFDKNDPTRLLQRSPTYFIKPETHDEIQGQVGNVCFLESLIFYHGRWFLYYGTADSKIAVAVHQPSAQTQRRLNGIAPLAVWGGERNVAGIDHRLLSQSPVESVP